MKIERVNIRAMEEEIQLKLDIYAKMLQKSAQDCQQQGVSILFHLILFQIRGIHVS